MAVVLIWLLSSPKRQTDKRGHRASQSLSRLRLPTCEQSPFEVSDSKCGLFGSRIATVSLKWPEFLARGSLVMGYGPTLERLFGSNLELLI
jgi:hypothetical protein